MTTVLLRFSTRADKRLMALFPNRTTHFGAKRGSTYVDHGDDEVRAAWLARHEPRENWRDYESAGALARWLLWEKKSLREAIEELNMRQRTWRFKMARRRVK